MISAIEAASISIQNEKKVNEEIFDWAEKGIIQSARNGLYYCYLDMFDWNRTDKIKLITKLEQEGFIVEKVDSNTLMVGWIKTL